MRANATIGLIHQANYLLDWQLRALEERFIEGGGYSEQLATARIAARHRTAAVARSRPLPNCPQCGKPMALRTVKQGQKAGTQFWGCSGYPACKGYLPPDLPACQE